MRKNLYSKLIILILLSLFSPFAVSQASEAIPVGQSSQSIPTGQSEGTPVTEEKGITSDIFGREGGILHPFITVEERWTDNLFITESNKKDDFITTVAPGIWVAVPANREKLLSIDTRTTSPGGLQLSRIKPKAARRYQAYALYSPEAVFYANNSQHDHINHKAEAMYQYNLNNGLSFDLMDLFKDKEDISGDGITDTLFRYQSNLVDFITTYDPSEKLTLRFDYSNYYLNYKEDVNRYRDRMDNTVNLYAFYKFWPKTSLFVQYAHAWIDFDQDDLFDSTEDRYYAGVNWAMTAKTRGRLKLGYTNKDFDQEGLTDQDGFSFELQAQHNLSPKRSIQVNAFRKFNESDTPGATSFNATGMDIGIIQRFTEKWTGTLNINLERDEYNGIDREDDYLSIGPVLRVKPREWLFFDFAYYWATNDSNIPVNDYTSHTLLLRASLSF